MQPVPRFAWLFAVLVACGGSAATTRVHKPGEEYLTGIRIEGSTAIDPDDLVPRLGLDRNVQRQGSLDDYQLSLDVSRIEAAYQKLGYFAVDVTSRLDKAPRSDAATVVFTVKPGPRATTHVEILGLPANVPEAKARKLVEVAEGAPFDYGAFDAAKQPLVELVEDSGYAHPRMIANVIADRVHATAVLRYQLDPGPASTFGQVTLVGATGRLAEAVQDRLQFGEGQPYSLSAISDSQKALYKIGLFSSVRIEPDEETDNPVVPVKITVTQGTKNELSWGGGVGYDPLAYSVRLRLQYIRHGVITPLTTSNTDLRPGYAFETATCGQVYNPTSCKSDFRGRAIETVTQQDFLFPDVKAEVEGGVDYLAYEAYAKLGVHARLGLSGPLGTDKLRLSGGWRVEAADFPSVYIDAVDAAALGIGTVDDIGALHTTVNYVGAFTTGLQLDLRDQPINTTKGAYADVHVSKGTSFPVGNFNYWQVTSEVRGFYPIGSMVLAVRAKLGTITGDVPATERYYGGGASSMRGFGQRGMSPRALAAGVCDANGVCPTRLITIGGAALLETSAELRIPLPRLPIGTVVFFDGGDVTRTVSELDPLHEYFAAGVGLRWLSPIGPVGVDVAYRFNRVLPTESHYNPLITIGEAF